MNQLLQTARLHALLTQHLDAAYNLARWLTHDVHDAEDCVQEACLRALRFYDGFRGGDGRAWLLAIVRNTCFDHLKRRQREPLREYIDGEDSLLDEAAAVASTADDPQTQLLRAVDARRIEAALQALPPEFREVLVLREMEELAYKQIADVIDAPIGTVMSRLARARAQLRRLLTEETAK